jgi:protein TonB
MRYFSVINALLYCSVASSQAKTPEVIHVIEDPIGCTVEKIIEERIITCKSIETDAQVKDQKHWLSYLDKNLAINPLAQDTIPGGIYNITAIFIIDKEGCISDVKIQNDPGYGLGNKIINVISRYKEKWDPAIRNGRNVRAYKKQVVTIIVNNEKCKEKMQEEFIL